MSNIKPGVYQHYKGSQYFVFGEGMHTETGEIGIWYLALENDKEGRYKIGDYFFRPKEMFLEEIVEGVPRFKLME